MFWLLKYFDNFKNFTSHSMSMLSSTRKLGSKGSTLSKSNLDIMKNSSHRDEYPAMQSNGPLPQVGGCGCCLIRVLSRCHNGSMGLRSGEDDRCGNVWIPFLASHADVDLARCEEAPSCWKVTWPLSSDIWQ